MAKIRIVGDSSGYVELAASDAAGNNTLELPSNATKLVGADSSNSLNVTGISTFSGGLLVGTGASVSSPSSNVLTLGTNNVERVRVDSSGRLGIGTVTPGVQVTVDQETTDGNLFDLKNEEVRLFTGVWGTGSTYPREVTLNATRIDSETFPTLRLAGQGGIKFAVDLNTVRMEIDSSGRVTMPYQPHAEGGINSGASNTSPTSSEIVRFDKADVNVGGHYDTSQYRFNCPVTGNYLVHAHAQTNGQTTTLANTVNFNIRKNGASVSGVYETRYYGASAPGYVKLEITDVVYATAGDYLDIYAIISNTSLLLEYSAADVRWRFSYTLLG